MLDKDKWERYRRAVWDIDSEDTDSEGNDSEGTIESLGGEQKVDVKKTVSFKKFYSVIRGDMGLTDRRREATTTGQTQCSYDAKKGLSRFRAMRYTKALWS